MFVRSLFVVMLALAAVGASAQISPPVPSAAPPRVIAIDRVIAVVNDEAITHAIIALSHGLGMRVIAEGVETPAQYRFLAKNGCEEAQGFYIGRPAPPEAFEELVAGSGIR